MARSGLAVVGRVWTGNPSSPVAGGLVLRHGAVVEVAPAHPSGPGAVLRLPPGAVVLPGFVDPHLHLLSAAARLLSVEAGPSAAPDVRSLLERLAAARRLSAPGGWVRAAGWDESLTAEGRQPTLAELDAAVPDRALVVHHATGHAALLNTVALGRLPSGAGVERGPDGSPTGLVGDPAGTLSGLVPPLSGPELRRAAGLLGAELAEAGVVAVADATHTNDGPALDLLAGLAGEEVIPQRVVAMPGVAALAGLRWGGAVPGGGGPRFRLGHAKVMPDRTDPEGSVAEAVRECSRRGWPVAVHCVEVDELEAAVARLGRAPAPDGWRHRLEHVALALPEQVAALAAAGLDVVTNPVFRVERATKYQRRLSGPELGWLYRHRSLLDAGVRVAAASDAPTGRPRPLAAVAAARSRPDGEVVGADAALASVTVAAAAVCGPVGADADATPDWPAGPLRPGRPADLVVLDRWPGSAEEARAARVIATVVGGRAVHGSADVPAASWEPGGPARPR